MGVSASKEARANGPAVPRPESPQEAAATNSAPRALMLPFEAWTAQPFSVLANGEEDPSVQLAEVMDRSLHYLLSRATLGLSPMGLAQAYFDWLVHLIASPGKQLQLWHKGVRKSTRLVAHLARCATQGGDGQPCITPLPQDRRFSSPEWQEWPFNVIHQTFLLQQQWWHNAATGVHGVSAHHERVLECYALRCARRVGGGVSAF